MREISMTIIQHISELRDRAKITTQQAMDMVIAAGIYKASELPDVHVMHALIKGIKLKREKSRSMNTMSKKAIEDLIDYIEGQAETTIPNQAKVKIRRELNEAYKLYGEISQAYIDGMIILYKHHKTEATPSDQDAASAS